MEGAPELDAVLPLVADPAMEPPVAGLVYALDEPSRAAFYPMAAFSPEWIALRWALARGRRVQLIDLPVTHVFGIGPEPVASRDSDDVRVDPLAALAAAAGYGDAETWWEDMIEHRHNGLEVFDVILNAMREVRSSTRSTGPHADRNELREAAMRRVIRTVRKQHDGGIAVVCGAWHAPALVEEAFPSAAADSALLRGLPKMKVAATWVPWTSQRLSRASGYGAGIDSPGWYAHLFRSPDDVVTRWMTRAVRLLRAEGMEVSTAAAIDAVRLAETLATLRSRPAAGLDEVMEASRAALCGGSDVPLHLIRRDLLVGDDLGSVPPSTPMVPLERDVAATARRLRLTRAAVAKTVELDLRTASGLDRSRLLHRLRLLGVPWGQWADVGRTLGTFKEAWVLEWAPELSVAIIEAGAWGTTTGAATTAKVEADATAADLGSLTVLVEQSLLADLPDALAHVVAALRDRAAQQRDVVELMRAVEPLTRVARYGDVRSGGRALPDLDGLLDAMVRRIAIGLPSAVASLDDEPAADVQALVEGVHRGLATLDRRDLRDVWERALVTVADQTGVHGAVAGRAVRLLLDAGRISGEEARRRLSLALSRAADHLAGAAWLESFLLGDALLLLHDRPLLEAIDGWLQEVAGDVFDDVLPILRRSFARWEPAERRMVGDHVRRLTARRADGGGGADRDDEGPAIDPERAALVVPHLRRLLGAEG